MFGVHPLPLKCHVNQLIVDTLISLLYIPSCDNKSQTTLGINMEDIVLKRAIAMLSTIKASYVIEHKGTRYSEGEVSGVYGARDGKLTAHVTKHIENLKIGEVTVIPLGDWKHSQIQAVALSKAAILWGAHSGTTCQEIKDGEVTGIQFMRLAAVEIEEVSE